MSLCKFGVLEWGKLWEMDSWKTDVPQTLKRSESKTP